MGRELEGDEHARTHARTHTHTHTYARTHGRTHARARTHAHARTHARTHTHTRVTETEKVYREKIDRYPRNYYEFHLTPVNFLPADEELLNMNQRLLVFVHFQRVGD